MYDHCLHVLYITIWGNPCSLLLKRIRTFLHLKSVSGRKYREYDDIHFRSYWVYKFHLFAPGYLHRYSYSFSLLDSVCISPFQDNGFPRIYIMSLSFTSSPDPLGQQYRFVLTPHNVFEGATAISINKRKRVHCSRQLFQLRHACAPQNK